MDAESICRSAFFELCAANAGAGVVDCAWQVIRNRYCEAHRHYHTLQHIAELLILTEEWEDKLQNPSIVRWAVFYHDIIYDATSTHNEEDSAELWAREASTLGIDGDSIAAVTSYILATKAHGVDGKATRDLDLFLDFDMSILGRFELRDYQAYTQQVRLEFGHLTDEQWKTGRSAFLSSTLALADSFVYRSLEMRASLEENAGRNMRWELSHLQGAL